MIKNKILFIIAISILYLTFYAHSYIDENSWYRFPTIFSLTVIFIFSLLVAIEKNSNL